MKHWDGRDRTEAIELRPARREAAQVRDSIPKLPRSRRAEPQIGSLIGLAFAIFFLAALSWAVAPSSPVSDQLLD